MNIEQLSILLEVVQKGSFAAVALLRQVNASSISRTIQTLEKSLGFRLFQRTTRHLQLTEAGAVYVESIRPLMEQLALAKVKALDTKLKLQGTLRVTLPLGFAEAKIIPLLPAFRKRHPDLKLELLITDECLDLEKERIDVGVRLGKVSENNWVAKSLSNLGMKLCATPEFLKEYPCSSPTELSQMPCLNFIRQAGSTIWHFKEIEGRKKQDVTINEVCLATTASAVKGLCLLSQGVALLSDWMVEDELAKGDLVEVLPNFIAGLNASADKAYCIYPSRDYVPAKTRVFIDFLMEEMKES